MSFLQMPLNSPSTTLGDFQFRHCRENLAAEQAGKPAEDDRRGSESYHQ